MVLLPGVFSATSLRAASGELHGTATSPHGASYGSAGDRGFPMGATLLLEFHARMWSVH